MIYAITAIDLLVIYAIPLVALGATFVGLALLVYLLARSPLDFDFKHDLRRKFEERKQLPSGASFRFSFACTAELLLGDNCVQATFLYRVSRFLARRRLRLPAQAVHSFSKFLTHVDVSPYAEIGPGVFFYHGLGAVIGKGTKIGARALICQGVTTGGGPRIGNDVKLWAGAKIIGRVTIGDRAEIGANAVVVRDVPADCTAVGVPVSRLIPKHAELSLEPRAAEAVNDYAIAARDLAGTPATQSPSGTSFVRTAPAPMSAPAPIRTPQSTTTPEPSEAPRSTTVSSSSQSSSR